MAGRFEGVSDLECKLFEDVLPKEPEKRGKGMPHVPFRAVLNTLLYVLITGCRWCDVPHSREAAGFKKFRSSMAQEMAKRRHFRKAPVTGVGFS